MAEPIVTGFGLTTEAAINDPAARNALPVSPEEAYSNRQR